MKGNTMGVNISPEYVLRKCDPAPHKCGGCGALVWVASEDYNYGRSRCDGCGDEPWGVDFYPTEFEKVKGHISYTTLFEIMGAMGLPKLHSGDVSTALVRSRLHLLDGHRLYQFIADMVESAEQHGVDIGFA
jgi:hypothetical protein